MPWYLGELSLVLVKRIRVLQNACIERRLDRIGLSKRLCSRILEQLINAVTQRNRVLLLAECSGNVLLCELLPVFRQHRADDACDDG